MALNDLIDDASEINDEVKSNENNNDEKGEKEPSNSKTDERAVEPKACPYCSVVGEYKGTGVFECVNDMCDNNVYNMDWVYFHDKRGDDFLGDVDMVEIRDELQDIIPYIR